MKKKNKFLRTLKFEKNNKDRFKKNKIDHKCFKCEKLGHKKIDHFTNDDKNKYNMVI